MKKAAAALVAVGISLLVAFGAVELMLRASIARMPVPFLIYLNADLKDRLPRAWVRLREVLTLADRQEDPDVGWTFKPRLTITNKNEDGEPYTRTTSAEGFFTPDEPGKSTPQLVTVGASFLATFYVRRPVQNVLRDELRTPVYNLAVGGWGPESYLAAYEKFAAARRHDLVIVFTVPSDPSNVVNWRRWKNEDSPESFMTWMQKTATADEAVNRRQSWPDTHLVVWNLMRFVARPKSQAGAAAAEGALPTATTPFTMEHFAGVPGFDIRLFHDQLFMFHDPDYFLPGGDYYPDMQEYFECLVRMKAAIESHGARMLLVMAPSKERVYVAALPPEKQRAYVTTASRDINGLEGAVTAFAAQEGIAFFDLTPVLVDHAKAGEKLYFTLDGHWNSHGNEVAGKALSEFVKTLDPRAPRPPYAGPRLFLRRGPVPIERAIASSAMTSHAAIVRPAGGGVRIRGRAESPFGYLAQWPDVTINEPQWLLATGVVNRGGASIGLLKDGKWATQYRLRRGRFDIALPVLPGTYQPIVANDLTSDDLDNDVELTSFGWAALK